MKKLLVVLLVASCARLAVAQETAPPVVSTSETETASSQEPTAAPTPVAPSPEMEQLRAFVGSWRCEGEFSTSTEAPEKAAAALTLEFQLTHGGFWLAGKARRDKTKTPVPVAEERSSFWSYDSVGRMFVGGWLDSRGAWASQTSFGWSPTGELVMYGHTTLAGGRHQGKEIFTRPVEGGFMRRYEVLQVDRWIRISEETCRTVTKPKPKRR
jgi:hypothetical protein